jgi:hypothetical protein
MQEFICQLLETKARPLSISEVVEEFDKAGYDTIRASIRGRLNTLTYDGRISRVARGIYAATGYGNIAREDIETKDAALPEIPAQEDGLAFEISSNGRIGLAATGFVSDDDDIAQLEALRDVLLDALDDLLGATEGSNAFSTVRRVAQQYRSVIDGKIFTISIDHLYAYGIRLDNANLRLKADIASGDLPDTGLLAGEALDSVLAIHGPTILSTRRGPQLIERSRRYNVSRLDELNYKVHAVAFATALAGSHGLVEPEVKDAIESLNDEIGEGRFPERSSDIARQSNRNLIVTLANLALIGVGKPVVLATVATGFAASQPGMVLSGIATELANAAALFLQSHGQELRMLAAFAGSELSWLTAFLDWWKRRRTD